VKEMTFSNKKKKSKYIPHNGKLETFKNYKKTKKQVCETNNY